MPLSEQKGYKLTDQDGYTRGGEAGETHWEIGKRVEVRGKGSELCSADVLHYYASPELASFFNCIHADIDKPILWEVEVENKVADDGTKCGAKALTPTKRDVPLPVLTSLQRVEVAIRCVKKIAPKDWPWHIWADNWLSGKDRTKKTAWAAAAGVAGLVGDTMVAARAAAYRAAWAAIVAARAAAEAVSWSAAKVEEEAEWEEAVSWSAARVEEEAEWEEVVAWAAEAVAWAAAGATKQDNSLNITSIIRQVLKGGARCR